MRFLSYLTMLFVATVLAACGGGGGSPGLSLGSVSAFSVTAPSVLTLQVGLTQQYAIKGGVKPYAVTSTDPAVAVGWVGGEDVLVVGAVVPGKATIAVTDAKGSVFSIAVTAGSSTAFFTTAPTSLTIAPIAAAAQTYTLGGGTPPYTAVSNFPRVASVSVNGDRVTITGNPTGEQDPAATALATVTFRDAAGATLSSQITVATPKLTLSVDKAQAYRGDVVIATISGGTPPYRAQSSFAGVVTPIIVNGNRLEMTLERLADPAIVSVFDANNQRADVSLTIIDGAPDIRISPASLTVSENETAPILLTTYGVSTAGAPTVFSSDPTLLQATYSNKVITVVTGTRGTRCVPADSSATITIVDSAGHMGTSTITIKDNNGKAGCSTEASVPLFTTAPVSLTLAPGAQGRYTVGGGTSPYTAVSSNPAVVGVSLSGTSLTITGLQASAIAVTITIRDAAGDAVTVSVTVGTAVPLSISAPAALTIAPGAAGAQTYAVSGGLPPYTANSNNPAVANVSLIGNSFTIVGVQVSGASATITIRDSSGATVSTVVTVGTVPLKVNPASFTAFIGDVVRAIISGGSPPYRIQLGIDETLLKAKIVNGNEVEVVGGQVATAAPVTIIDAANQSVVMTVTLSNAQDVLRISPNALTIPESATTPNLNLTVFGATATGGIQVFTSNAAILNPTAPVSNTDGSYTITLKGGDTCSLAAADRVVTITVLDAKGKIGTSVITVKDYSGAVGC